jgi:outer membrane protein assembly factor BamB
MAFSLLDRSFVVSQRDDGMLFWSGTFNGMPIRRAIPLEDGNRCIILLDPDATKQPVFANLLCIDRTGTPVWTAKLPTNPDVFLEATLEPEGLLTHTWSGMNIVLDQNTGDELRRRFVK